MKLRASPAAATICAWVEVRPSGAAGAIGAGQSGCAIAGNTPPAKKTSANPNLKRILPPACPEIALDRQQVKHNFQDVTRAGRA
jgi:hypothetical protein